MSEDKLVFVRAIMGKDGDDATAKERYHYIQDGGVNDLIKSWHEKQPERDWKVASPSRLLTCPRVIWLHNQGVEPTNGMTWAVKQRMLLGRLAEGIFAKQFKDEGILLHHWEDEPDQKPNPFTMGEGLDSLEGTPDFLLNLPVDGVAVSDAKTSRSDSFGYVPLGDDIWTDWGWYKYRIQLTAYFMLCQASKKWFDDYNAPDSSLPLPEVCHLFSYALDDGVVRREETWEPTKEDMETVKKMTRRFNEAVVAKEMPKCTCKESYDGFDVKFCDYGVVIEGKKISEECCSDSLAPKQEKLA